MWHLINRSGHKEAAPFRGPWLGHQGRRGGGDEKGPADCRHKDSVLKKGFVGHAERKAVD